MATASARRVFLEVAVASVEDAVVAEAGGTDRLELSGALALGGLTPSLGCLVEVRQAVSLPLVALARPRSGGFCYSAGEWRVLQRDVDLLLEHGADGIAFGVLTDEGEIAPERCRQIVRQVGKKQAVFHRAFDVTPDPVRALETLIDLGVRRVMTSGQEASAGAGSALIAGLIRQAAGRLEVLPAAGINRFTVRDVVSRTGCSQVHASLRGSREDRSTLARPQVSFGSARGAEDRYDATSPDEVAAVRRLLDE